MEPFKISEYKEDDTGKFRCHTYEFYSLDHLEKFLGRRRDGILDQAPIMTSITKDALKELEDLHKKASEHFNGK